MIPFNIPEKAEREEEYLKEVLNSGKYSSPGVFSFRNKESLREMSGAKEVFMTHSCTGALEMMALILGIKPGDNIILPTYTFVSSANAFALRGAHLRFADCKKESPLMDVDHAISLINDRTKAVLVVHYSGIVPEGLDRLLNVCKEKNIVLLEDAAQGVGAKYQGRWLGSLGDMGAHSFHDTKNITCGEGGCLLVNREKWVEQAEVIWEKGTDRAAFLRGDIDSYSWQQLGSSYGPSEFQMAVLASQLEELKAITKKRKSLWDLYHSAFEPAEKWGLAIRPKVPEGNEHNGLHYFILLPDRNKREDLQEFLKKENIQSASHYVPLHNSSFGEQFLNGPMPYAENVAGRLLRLPLYAAMKKEQAEKVIETVLRFWR